MGKRTSNTIRSDPISRATQRLAESEDPAIGFVPEGDVTFPVVGPPQIRGKVASAAVALMIEEEMRKTGRVYWS